MCTWAAWAMIPPQLRFAMTFVLEECWSISKHSLLHDIQVVCKYNICKIRRGNAQHTCGMNMLVHNAQGV